MTILEFVRQFRLGEYAIFDLAVSFLGMYLLAPLLSKLFKKISIKIPKINWIFLTLPIGIVAHLLTGTMTPMTKHFLDINSHYFIKLIIIISLVLGLRRIRKTKKYK